MHPRLPLSSFINTINDGVFCYDIVPDILTTSKALGQGVPVAAVITTDEIASKAVAKGFDQGATHMGDSFQCAVALANIEVIERENLLMMRLKLLRMYYLLSLYSFHNIKRVSVMFRMLFKQLHFFFYFLNNRLHDIVF